MDRNRACTMTTTICTVVALRKESVDRNSIRSANFRACTMSLSARRAWIEIVTSIFIVVISSVALRKESVDRNSPILKGSAGGSKSLSARRAWIEICKYRSKQFVLRCRSPQGERG